MQHQFEARYRIFCLKTFICSFGTLFLTESLFYHNMERMWDQNLKSVGKNIVAMHVEFLIRETEEFFAAGELRWI